MRTPSSLNNKLLYSQERVVSNLILDKMLTTIAILPDAILPDARCQMPKNTHAAILPDAIYPSTTRMLTTRSRL